jgi:hypothetical protein
MLDWPLYAVRIGCCADAGVTGNCMAKQEALTSSAKTSLLGIDLLCTLSREPKRSREANDKSPFGDKARAARLQHTRSRARKRIGLVNEPGPAIHHIPLSLLFFEVAFIFDKCLTVMVNTVSTLRRALTRRSY